MNVYNSSEAKINPVVVDQRSGGPRSHVGAVVPRLGVCPPPVAYLLQFGCVEAYPSRVANPVSNGYVLGPMGHSRGCKALCHTG